METFTAILPTHWACYLINDDPTSFSLYGEEGDAELERIDAWCEANPGACVGVSEESEIRHGSPDCDELPGDYSEFKFIRY